MHRQELNRLESCIDRLQMLHDDNFAHFTHSLDVRVPWNTSRIAPNHGNEQADLQYAWILDTLSKIEALKREIGADFPGMTITENKMAVTAFFKNRPSGAQFTEIHYYAPNQTYLFQRGNRVHKVFSTTKEILTAMGSDTYQDMSTPTDEWYRQLAFCHELQSKYNLLPSIFDPMQNHARVTAPAPAP